MAEKITFDMHVGQRQMMAEMARMRAGASATPLPPMANGVTGMQQPSFGAVLNQAISHRDNVQHAASVQQPAQETGQRVDSAAAMLESQKDSVAFSVLAQVRDRLSTAFDDVINTTL